MGAEKLTLPSDLDGNTLTHNYCSRSYKLIYGEGDIDLSGALSISAAAAKSFRDLDSALFGHVLDLFSVSYENKHMRCRQDIYSASVNVLCEHGQRPRFSMDQLALYMLSSAKKDPTICWPSLIDLYNEAEPCKDSTSSACLNQGLDWICPRLYDQSVLS